MKAPILKAKTTAPMEEKVQNKEAGRKAGHHGSYGP